VGVWNERISSGGGMVAAFSRRTDGLPLVQAGSLQLDAVGAMDDAIQDRVTNGWIAHEFMPAPHGNLAGHQQRPLPVAVLDDL
jgi:hypothetical protein